MATGCREEEDSLALWDTLMASEYAAQAVQICEETGWCDVAPQCLGSMSIYKALSEIIPKDRVIYDIGCAQAFQAWYFRDHLKYIGVCPLSGGRLTMPNSEHLEVTCGEFLASAAIDPVHFAICAYVPPWFNENAEELVRRAFDHIFVFYPRARDADKPVRVGG